MKQLESTILSKSYESVNKPSACPNASNSNSSLVDSKVIFTGGSKDSISDSVCPVKISHAVDAQASGFADHLQSQSKSLFDTMRTF